MTIFIILRDLMGTIKNEMNRKIIVSGPFFSYINIIMSIMAFLPILQKNNMGIIVHFGKKSYLRAPIIL